MSVKNLGALLAAVCQELTQIERDAGARGGAPGGPGIHAGSIYLGAEDVDHLMMRLPKNEINFGHYIPLDDIVSGLLKVTAGEIQEMACELLRAENWALSLLGPVGDQSYALDF